MEFGLAIVICDARHDLTVCRQPWNTCRLLISTLNATVISFERDVPISKTIVAFLTHRKQNPAPDIFIRANVHMP